MKENWEIAESIEARRRSLAESVVAQQYSLQPGLRERYGDAGREKCIQDTEYHLSYVAAAVRFSSPALLYEYIAWATSVLTTYGVELEDVDRNIVCLRELLREKLPHPAGQIVASYVDGARKALSDSPAGAASFFDGSDSLTELARNYLGALLECDRFRASRLILDAASAGVSLTDLYLQVLQRSQWEVGRLWQQRIITVAQEHFCTAATQLVMSQLYPYLFNRPRNGRRLVAASVAGELHEMGLRVVTDVFEAAGWDTVYLGANTPSDSILESLAVNQPNLLLISATMAFNLNAAARLIALVRSSDAGRDVTILVGGYPCNIDADLWRQLDADGYACDAAEALVSAEDLLRVQASHPRSRSRTNQSQPEVLPNLPKPLGEVAVYEELTRLNNDLVTAQRELARKNSELERLHQRLLKADRRKDEFLATLAHELRNPLATIRTALELMRLSADDPTLEEEVRSMMETQAHHLTQLVDDLLDISRITSGKILLRTRSVALADVVRNAVDIAQPLLKEAGHDFRVALPQSPIILEGDPTRLAQIISNLLSNAARYTPRGGRIRLMAERQQNDAVIKVADSGIGIPTDKLEVIFDMFTQLDEAKEHSQSGLGIGLMLVKRLTEAHGGSVEVRSEGSGKGSEFIIRLPIRVEPA